MIRHLLIVLAALAPLTAAAESLPPLDGLVAEPEPGQLQDAPPPSESDVAALDEDAPLEGHSWHGQVFNEGPRQAAYLMPSSGAVHFPVTTYEDEVQGLFDQGVGQLHGFWYFEAERSFRQVAAIDPSCAMAYWGMALANPNNEARAAAFAREAWLLAHLVTDREFLYIESLARFYGVDQPLVQAGEPEPKPDPADNKDRWARLLKDFDELVYEYPDDIEAKAFLVVNIWHASRRGRLQTPSRTASQALLEDVFAAQPNHPAHHYRIHLWDAKDSARYAVDSALASGPSGPSVAHMWHMGGHIFDKLGRHADAAWQQEASARVDHAHMMRDLVLPDQIHNFAHNNEWLIRSYGNVGRVRDAVDLARNMVELPRHPKYNGLDKRGSSSWWGRRRLLGTLEQYELWDELIALTDTMYLEPSDAWDDADRAFLLFKAYAFRGDREAAADQLDLLRGLVSEERVARTESMTIAEDTALLEGLDEDDVRDAMVEAMEQHQGPLEDLVQKIGVAEALTTIFAETELDLDFLVTGSLEGDADAEAATGPALEEAFETLRDARFSQHALARLHLDVGEPEEALKIARRQRTAGRAHSMANLAYILEEVGEHEEAVEEFEALREFSARFDLDVPAFARLAPLAQAAGYGGDWRVAFALPEDIASRPDLETLGPRRWAPPQAPAFSCPDVTGATHTLADHAGRPTIVIMFLGFGCVHCVEQLQAFGPVAQTFADAGIDIVAIGTDPLEKIAEGGADAYPFPLLADPAQTAFRAYRAYDDFEGMALHGTYLIDGEGRIRWHDISYEPFMDTAFLLEEARRLLGLPVDEATAWARSSAAIR